MKKVQSNSKDLRKIAIYSRKSKFTGRGESTINQIEMCKKKIELHFSDVDLKEDVIIFEDEGFTGYNTKRPGYQSLLEHIRNKKIKAVVFYKIDRISRNVSDFSNLLTELAIYDVSFISATESIENITPSGRAMMYMISVFAQLERDTTAERIKDNMLELAKTGRWLGGNTPTGYQSKLLMKKTIDGKTRRLYQLTINRKEVEIVKTIFTEMLNLKSLTKLETYTIKNNILTKNNKYFTRWTLKSILTNPVYAIADSDIINYFQNKKIKIYNKAGKTNSKNGLIAYNKTKQNTPTKQVVKRKKEDWVLAIGKHEGIISGKSWLEVQKILKTNEDKRYRRPSSSNALLSGILYCSCGSHMRPKLKQKKEHEEKRNFNYICELKEKSKKTKCQCINLDGLKVDEIIKEQLKKYKVPKSLLIKSLTKNKDLFKELDESNLTIKKQIKQNENNIKSLVNRLKYIDTSLIKDICLEIKDLKEENILLNKKLKNKELNTLNNCDILEIITNYYQIFDKLDINEQKNLIRLLIKKVEFDGVYLNIYLN